MASFTITGLITAPQTLSASSDIGEIGPNGTLVTGSSIAINVASTGGGALIVNGGMITTNNDAISAFDSFSLINTGLIATEGIAIFEHDNASHVTNTVLNNTGEIISGGNRAIFCVDPGMHVLNDGYISGPFDTIQLSSTGTGDLSFVVNSGRIVAATQNSTAIFSGDGLSLVNTGEILGGVVSGGGNDIIDNRQGIITGSVDLGIGNNLFRGGSGDEVVLTGSGIDTQRGGGGDDALISGAGDDQLFGG